MGDEESTFRSIGLGFAVVQRHITRRTIDGRSFVEGGGKHLEAPGVKATLYTLLTGKNVKHRAKPAILQLLHFGSRCLQKA